MVMDMPESAADIERIEVFYQAMRDYESTLMGYPTARDFNYDILKPFLDISLNNCGDPFAEGIHNTHSFEFEREVLSWWAESLCAPADNWWGYVTNGGTEGNLYGLYLARELYSNGVVYYSQDSHYSVSKNLHFLNMRNIMIRSQANGEMDYEDLRETLRINRDTSPIIFANIGTTMTEAKDDLGQIKTILQELAIPNYYLHCDAALCGAFLPFIDSAIQYNFAHGAHSISISGHKFIGSPIPCGLVLALKENVNRIARSVAYIGNLDTTITGSRNGLTPMILWYAMKCFGQEGMAERAKASLSLAAYAEASLKDIGVEAWRNPDSLTVVMPEVPGVVKDRWQLATANGISHIMLMPYLTRQHVNQFVSELQAELNAEEGSGK